MHNVIAIRAAPAPRLRRPFPISQQLSEKQLKKPIQPSERISLEEWIAQPIRTPKGNRPIRCGNEAETAAFHRMVRLNHALGVHYMYFEGEPRNGDLLRHKISNRCYHLQKLLFATEGRAPVAVQQEAKDAEASQPPPKVCPEIRAYFERLWGPLKNAGVTDPSWPPSTPTT